MRVQFLDQRKNARLYGKKEWTLIFADWLEIWIESGHWHERGHHKNGYVLAMKDKRGGFTKDNVHVVTLKENSRATQNQRWQSRH